VTVTPSWDFALIQALNYLLFVVVLVHAWRQAHHQAIVMVAAVIFGYVVEYTQVTNASGLPGGAPYAYTQALVALPGPVPLGVVLSWGLVLFLVLRTVGALGAPLALRPIVAGLLAVALDFVTDPAFVALDFWSWKDAAQPGWYGIPGYNFVGWFVIVASYTLVLELAWRRWPPERSRLWLDGLVALVAIPVAMVLFVPFMLGYLALSDRLDGASGLLMPAVLAPAAIALLWWLPRLKRSSPPDLWALSVPGFLGLTSLVVLYASGLFVREPTLNVSMPLLLGLVVLATVWPALDRLGGQRGPAGDEPPHQVAPKG